MLSYGARDLDPAPLIFVLACARYQLTAVEDVDEIKRAVAPEDAAEEYETQCVSPSRGGGECAAGADL